MTPEPLAKYGLMYTLTYSVMAWFQASAATRPRAEDTKVSVWMAISWEILLTFFFGLTIF